MSKQKTPTTKYWNGDKLQLIGTVPTWPEAQHLMSALNFYFCDSNPSRGFNVYVRIPQIQTTAASISR